MHFGIKLSIIFSSVSRKYLTSEKSLIFMKEGVMPKLKELRWRNEEKQKTIKWGCKESA